MKICPICNEKFSDEFSFCEIDGTKLKRQSAVAATAPATAKKDWSLLGIALVLGAILITGASIIFTPKARITPPPSPAESVAVATPPLTPPASASAETPTTAATTDVLDATGASILAEGTAPGEAKKKEKPAKTEGMESETPNPKAAVTDPDAAAKAAKDVVQPAEQPEATKTDLEVKEARETEPRPRSVAPSSTESKDATKAATTKTEDKDAEAKKREEKKKKGGFFGVFKKIFGKENKDK